MSSSEYQEFMKFKAMQNERDTYRDLCGELLSALKNANCFIGNGIDFGFIRMPDEDVDDIAKEIPSIVESAITKAEKILGAS